MSGGGGGSWSSGGGGYVPVNPCEELNVSVYLLSPNPRLISTIRIGEKFPVKFNEADGKLVLVTSKGDVIGSIVNLQTVQIIKCIGEGYTFIGIIKDLNGGTCEVIIRNGTI
jgi:hypothetical protein